MAATTQLGTTLKIAFTGNTVGNLILEDVTTESSGEQTVIKDEDNATATILISDLGTKGSFTGIVEGDYAGDLPPALGSIFTVGSTKYRVESASYKQQRLQSMLTVGYIREASMATAYDA